MNFEYKCSVLNKCIEIQNTGEMEEIYVVKVRTEPNPARLYPSERRYSALTVGGLGAVHLLLAATSLLLGCLGMALQSDSCWTGRYGGGLWLGIAAAVAGIAGILAWRRWYVDNNIRWFFISSTVSATTSLVCLIITAAALAAIQEQKSTQEVYKSIYYDQGTIYEPTAVNNFGELPSLSLHAFDENKTSSTQTRLDTEPEIKISDHLKLPQFNSSDVNFPYVKNENIDDVSIDDIEETWLEQYRTQLNDSTAPDTGAEESDVKKDGNKSTHIMRISKGNKPGDIIINETLVSTLRNYNIDSSDNSSNKDHYNRLRKSSGSEEDEENSNNFHYKKIENDEVRDSNGMLDVVVSTINDESQDVQNVPHNTENNIYIYNDTGSELSVPKQMFRQDQPHYEKIHKGGREVRTVVAINVLVASALELAWSLLSVSIAWKGMKNCYPHENATSTCERTVEGLERSASLTNTNKSLQKMDDVFRKPDIISNHRHCKLGDVQSKNGINRLMINTVSERISTEPYLPMEENTMGYQERVRRFLASNNVATNANDNASNTES